MKRYMLYVICALVIFALVIVGCSPKDTSPSDVEPADTTDETVEEEAPAEMGPVEGGTLNIAVEGIVQFDPPMIVDTSSLVASQIYNYLFRSISSDEVAPELATSWDFEDGGKTVIFHLREGVYFHDDNEVFPKGESREVVASDVVYSIERSINLEGNNTPADLLQSFESVEAPDDYTVILHLNNPDAILFSSMRGVSGIAIIPQEAVEQLGDRWPHNPIGSGPFKLSSYTPDDSAVLVRNELYWIRPHLDGITFKIIPDQDAALIALEADEVQWANLPSTQYERFADNADYNIHKRTCPGSYQLQLNTNDETLQDKAVREAIAHAIDGQSIIKAILPGEYVYGCGVAGPGVPGHDEGLCERYFSYDTALTAQLLTDAGWEKNSDGIWEKDGEPLTLDMEMWNMDPMPKVGAAVLTQLKEAGFDAVLSTVEFGTWIQDYTGGTPKPIMMWSGFCGEGGLNSYYGRDALGSMMGFDNEEVFTILENANTMFDPVERNETLIKATDLIYADYPGIPLGFSTGTIITSAKLQDYVLSFDLLNIVTENNNMWIEQ
ncbi:MAG: ABC transporter substrate-binding protein [Anaerolineaceae bacterium]|nr:ABC transporter substrate-binding protein [Anaerolineaceae bacterium]